MTPNQRQLANARKIFDAFAQPFEEFHYGIGHEGSLRMSINGWVFVVHQDGTCSLHYPVTSFGPPWTGEYEERVERGEVDVS